MLVEGMVLYVSDVHLDDLNYDYMFDSFPSHVLLR